MTNETLKSVMSRYSCRAFKDETPSNELLNAIAIAGAASPSAMNRQPWRIIVVKSKALIAEIEAEGMRILAEKPDHSTYDRIMSRGGKLFYGAPCMMIIAIEHQQPDEGALTDCGIVTENIAIAAAGLGVNSLICGLAAIPFAGPKGEDLKRRLNFPDNYVFGLAVLLGFEVNKGIPHEPDLTKIKFIN